VYNNYCGDIEYVLSGSTQFITMDVATKTLTVASTNGSYVRNNHVCLTSRLKLYPANTRNQCFWVNITHGCSPSSYGPSSILASPLIHHIGTDSA
jgi:hypothetical protein